MIRRCLRLALVALLVPTLARAQDPKVQLATRSATDAITFNGDAVTLTNLGGLASLAIQTTGTFSLTWELQCAVDGVTFDADDEVPVTLVSSSPVPADSVATNVEGLYTASVAGYSACRVIATAYTSGTLTVTMTAVTSGGSSSGGGSSSSVSIVQGGNTAAVNASSQLSVVCANCSGTGVSANEDTAFAASAAVTPAGSQRQDTLSTDTDVTGDVQPLKGDAFGRLYTTGTGGTFPISGTAAKDAPVSGNPVYTAGRASAAAPTDVSADDDAVPFWLLRSGAQAVQPTFAGVLGTTGNGVSGTGVQRVTLASDSTGVLATVSTVTNVATIGTSVTPGTAAGNLGKAEDAIAGSGDTGVQMLGVRADTAAATAANGDYVPVLMDSIGRQWITGADVEDAVATAGGSLLMMGCVRQDTAASSSGTSGDNSNCTTDNAGRLYANVFGVTQAAATYLTVRLSDGSSFLTPSADSTHDSASGATGPQVMLRATTDLDALTAVSDGDAVKVAADTLGRQITVVGCGRDNRVRGQATITDGSSTSVLAAQGAGVIAEIYEIEIVNTSAVDVSVDIRDGTAGSVLWTLMAPATTDTGGGNNRTFSVPLTFTANTAVAADPSGAATSVIVSVLGCSVK